MSEADAISIRTTLEGEITWRRDEVRRLRNMQSMGIPKEAQDSLRRALIVMLYAHLEGYAKFSLEQYAEVINRAGLTVKEGRKQLAAACLSEKFKSYRTPDSADPFDPSGSRARQVLRDADFLEEMLDLQARKIALNVDNVTSADSNLSPSILRRNLAMLALDDSEIHRFTNALDGLLKLRNNIAHGERLNLPSDPSFEKLEGRIFGLCDSLTLVIYQSVRDETYRR
ncbi:MAE_28990/MAE_18760 family HEPN-like nuclease [Streptomyces griseorubiginosus]|uniref:MAE_28990/MAE_18760 family HEPN-like nuclease n=1 Tax=Streptomyces griseorubiginosus TaxID=67304 RepID=UPI0036BEE571